MVKSPYAGKKIVLTTQHQKEQVIGPIFQALLHAEVVLCEFDTDLLGTFSGEIERENSAMDCVKKKCLLGVEQSGWAHGLASEGSFGPHPSIPFLPVNQEIICFYDRNNDFFVTETYVTTETNYQIMRTDSWEDICQFAKNVLFPEHGLILRPNNWQDKSLIFKGILNTNTLKQAFKTCQAASSDKFVRIETDMRSHMNPLRQKAIKIATEKLAHRLQKCCPVCQTPGWGKIGVEKGLPCMACYFETEFAKKEIWGCSTCDHKEYLVRADGIVFASKADCSFCNP